MKRQSGKHKHFWEYLLINIFVFTGIFLLSFVLLNVSLFDPFTKAFGDFTLTDLYYSKVAKLDKIYNGPLVLVNLENRNRSEIAFLIQKLETGKPRVIGIDAIFSPRKDSSDSLLHQVISENNNLVLPYKASFDSLTREACSDPYFQSGPKTFVNLIGEQKEFSTLRSYFPVYHHIPTFTTAILQEYDSTLASELQKRKEHKTEIRYYGNQQNFIYHNFDEIMDPAFELTTLTNKIILVGYMGIPGAIDISKLDEDRFFTPLNSRLSGRSLPDMYGVIVNANIIRMALDKDYIYVFPSWLNFLLAFGLSWLLMPLFVNWFVDKALWFQLFTVFFQFAISILLLFFTIWLYARANVKIEASVVLVAVLLIDQFLAFYHHLIKFLRYKMKWNFHSKLLEGGH